MANAHSIDRPNRLGKQGRMMRYVWATLLVLASQGIGGATARGEFIDTFCVTMMQHNAGFFAQSTDPASSLVQTFGGPGSGTFFAQAQDSQLTVGWEASDAVIGSNGHPSLVAGGASVEFQVDTPGRYRFSGELKNIVGGYTVAEVSIEPHPKLATIELAQDEARALSWVQELDLVPDVAYYVTVRGLLAGTSTEPSDRVTSLVTLTLVPEPASGLLLAAGLLGWIAWLKVARHRR